MDGSGGGVTLHLPSWAAAVLLGFLLTTGTAIGVGAWHAYLQVESEHTIILEQLKSMLGRLEYITAGLQLRIERLENRR